MKMRWVCLIIILIASCKKRDFVESPFQAVEMLKASSWEKSSLDSLYKLNGGRLFWDPQRKNIGQVLEIMNEPLAHGIFAEYPVKELKMLYKLRNKRRSKVDSTRLDVLTSLNLVRLIYQVNKGIPVLSEDKKSYKKTVDIAQVFQFFKEPESPLPSPDFIFYEGLRKKLFTKDSLQDSLFPTRYLNLLRYRNETAGDSFYVLVNIPSNELYIIQKNNIIKSYKTITGKVSTPTPVLTSTIKAMVVNPDWKLPFSISSKEILPKLKENPDFLAEQNMYVYDRENNLVNPYTIDWNEYDSTNFKFRITQMQGDNNALGYFQFFFENKESVYIHDTPSRYLFNKDKRFFSHGCIRVENPMDLLLFLARHDNKNITEQDVSKLIQKGNTHRISLRTPIPVLIRYYTVIPSGDSLIYLNDIYEKDRKEIPLIKAGIQNRRS